MEGRHHGDRIFDVFASEAEMTVEELIRAAEYLVKSSRDNFMKGHLDAAKHDLLTVAAKIVGTLPGPFEQGAASPAKMQW
ncbi:hypothetical protein ES705_32316 [subsurface metagenome]